MGVARTFLALIMVASLATGGLLRPCDCRCRPRAPTLPTASVHGSCCTHGCSAQGAARVTAAPDGACGVPGETAAGPAGDMPRLCPRGPLPLLEPASQGGTDDTVVETRAFFAAPPPTRRGYTLGREDGGGPMPDRRWRLRPAGLCLFLI